MPQLKRFGNYLLLKKIAAGGMAELYKARKTGEMGFEKLLAIKTVLPHLESDEDFTSMFVDEAKVAALLDHQNIVQIYDLGRIEDSWCIVMEYVRGKDLRAVIGRGAKLNKPLSVPCACHVMSSVLSGLSYAHRKTDKGISLGIVHRDISPPNVLISYEGEVKIVDFGIAKAASRTQETRAGLLKGKLAYMSPEQAEGKNIDSRSDIFSAGVVLYEMLTGRRLFKGDTDIQTLEKVRAAKIEPLPHELNPQVPGELEAVLMRALSKDLTKRYQSASTMEEDLHKFMAGNNGVCGSRELSAHMRGLFRAEIEEEQREEEAWDVTEVSSTLGTVRHEDAPSIHHAAPAASPAHVKFSASTDPRRRVAGKEPRERDLHDSGISGPLKIAVAIAFAAALGLGYLYYMQGKETKYVLKVNPPLTLQAAQALQAKPLPKAAPAPAPMEAPKPIPAPAPPPVKAPSAPSAKEASPVPPQAKAPVAAGKIKQAKVSSNKKTSGQGKIHLAAAPTPVTAAANPAPAPQPAASPASQAPAPAEAPKQESFGTLNIDSRPWFFVSIDGVDKGMTPLAGIRLSAGGHNADLINTKLNVRRNFDFQVQTDKTTTIIINLKKDPPVRVVIR